MEVLPLNSVEMGSSHQNSDLLSIIFLTGHDLIMLSLVSVQVHFLFNRFLAE